MFKTIQEKYTAVIILMVTLFLGILLGINYLLLRSYSLSNARETADILLYHTDREIDLVFEGIEATIDALSHQRSVMEVDVEQMRDQFLAHVLSRSDYVRAIYLGTASGEMYEWGVGPGFVDYEPSFPPDYDPRLRPWYQEAIFSGAYTLSRPYVYASVEALGVTAAKPVYRENRLVGVLGLDLVLEGLQNLVASLKIQKGGKIILLTRQRQVLVNQFDPTSTDKLQLSSFSSPEFLEAKEPIVVEVDGADYLVHHKINDSTGWSLLLFVPYQEILSFSQENFRIILFFDILLMILLGAIVTYVSKKLLADPIHEIITVMDHHERGERHLRIPEQKADEFQMMARLYNNLADMRDSNEKKMEEEVQQRTTDVISLQKENMRLRIIEEKERIYSNIHDSLGARLTSINISNNVAKHALEREEPQLVSQMLNRIEDNTARGIEELRQILMGKESEAITGDEFIAFMTQHLRQRLELKQVSFTAQLPDADMLERFENDRLTELCKVIDEFVTNTLKHAFASAVHLEVAIKDEQLHVVYQDNGRGFDPRRREKKGFGLEGVYSRVQRLGGSVKVSSKPHKGVKFEIRLRSGRDV
jgi:methyl-accepting chemotaxis protein